MYNTSIFYLQPSRLLEGTSRWSTIGYTCRKGSLLRCGSIRRPGEPWPCNFLLPAVSSVCVAEGRPAHSDSFYVEKISNTPHSAGNQLPKQLHRVYVVITEITVSSLVFSKKIIFNYGGMRKWLPRRVSQTMAPLCETWNLSSELFPLRT